MALDLDFSRPLRTPADRRSLIEAVRDAEPHELELDCVEWKSNVDLGVKRWKAEIARQVLGFSNRNPDTAARMFEGCAYLLLGVEPGNLVGVTPIDAAELEDGVSPYVGDGPQWDPHYEEVEGKTVLIVTVESPRWGQPAFRLRREVSFPDDGVHWQSGDTFVRRRGKTERANASDLDMLDRRLLGGARSKSRLGVDLTPHGETPLSITAIDVSDEARARWIDDERRLLLSPLEQFENARPEQKSAFLEADRRDPDTYREEIEEYLEDAERHLLTKLRLTALARKVGAVELSLYNLTEDNFSEVDVELDLKHEGVVAAFEPHDLLEDELVDEFPRRPHIWGRQPRYRDVPPFSIPRVSPLVPLELDPPSPGFVINAPTPRIFFATKDMRPTYQYDLAAVYVIADASHAGSKLMATWMATAKNVSGVAQGEIALEVATEPLEPLQLFPH